MSLWAWLTGYDSFRAGTCICTWSYIFVTLVALLLFAV